MKIDRLDRKPVSPRIKDHLLKFYATKGPRKTSRRTVFKSTRKQQVAQSKEAKFEELDTSRRNGAMCSSTETLLREEEEAEEARLGIILDPELARPQSERKVVTILDSPTGPAIQVINFFW